MGVLIPVIVASTIGAVLLTLCCVALGVMLYNRKYGKKKPTTPVVQLQANGTVPTENDGKDEEIGRA